MSRDLKEWFLENIIGDSIVEWVRFAIWSILFLLLGIGLLLSIFSKGF